MSIVRETSSEWWTVVERVFRSTLGELQAGAESIDLLPVFEDLLLFLGEVEGGTD
jgi:hypothetical protein